MSQKDEKLREVIRELAAEFFSRESNRTSLLTVTGVEMRDRGSKAVILMTVLPEDQEDDALEFVRRRLSDLREYVNEHSRIGRVPFFEARIDAGEKNRQRLDEISRNV